MANAPGNSSDFRSVMASVDVYGWRTWLHVHLVMGVWRLRRILLAVGLIGFYLALPYLTVGGHPALLLDIPKRQFTVAGQVFWPQDFWYLLILILIFVVGTALLVALVGRFFCGWLCPYNVFLETIYRPLERLFEGAAVKRLNRARGKIGGSWRKLLTWTGFILVSALLAATATMIFTGPQAFSYGILLDVVEYPSAAIFYGISVGLILFNFAWFREQTCTIVCPYGRLQSAMLDPQSLVVAYDTKRGEPRGKPGEVTGDCVDCELCIKVCPTGIDIRNGNQMECIHCTACIDACNTVMTKLDRPINLIGFSSEAEMAGGKRNVIRPRTIIYAIMLAGLISVLAWRIAVRTDIQAVVLRPDYLPVATVVDDKPVIRQWVKLSLINRTGVARTVTLHLPEKLGCIINLQPSTVELPPNSKVQIQPSIDVPVTSIAGATYDTTLIVQEADGTEQTVDLSLRKP
ncbi:MAG TPA: cytochrome c oxidase accessory protein CcoG [Planctomycetota bacterium]|nr:cytochrome c oxidase accessory protein CcoG [Planctomycetota bacterium]